MLTSLIGQKVMQRYSRRGFVTKALRLVWIVVILFGEVWVFVWSLTECEWPSVPQELKPVRSTRVLLVADTQVHHHALLTKESWWFHPWRHILFELNLRKSWHVTSYLRPDAVVFLGDLLSNGKAAKNHEQYKAAADKFKSIFHISDPSTEVYFVPGNNDVGLGNDRPTSRMLRSFYQEIFGDLNRKFVLQNHTFITIDSAGLVDEDYLRNGEHVSFGNWLPLPHGTASFVNQVAHQKPADPVILLSHIPLARTEAAHCGPLRERGTIRRGAGPGWQSTLSKQSTNFLLDTLRPSVIFSADNRDYCDYTHTIRDHPDSLRDSAAQKYRVREITLKSFSMSVHIRRPGFQLLTLVDPVDLAPAQQELTSHVPPSLVERACFLPDQFRIYNYLYAPLFVLSLLMLARFHFLKTKKQQFRTKPPFLDLKSGLGGRTSEDRSSVSDSPLSPVGPSISTFPEPLWSPFAPFTPVKPLVSPDMRRQPSTTSLTTLGSIYRQSSVSSLSSTMTLLGGEGDYHLGKELDERDLIYDSPPDYAMSGNTERVSSSALDLESFRDEVVDEEAVPAATFVEPETVISSNPRRTRFFRWSRSYSFVFRGRRRMIRVGLPSRSALWNLIEFIGVVDERSLRLVDMTRKSSFLDRRRGMGGYFGDVVDVFLPAVLVWLIVNLVSLVL